MRTREKILEAAVTCFGADGFQACSMDTIAQAAKITKGAIYTHFASKSDLIIAIIEYVHRRALGKARELEHRMSTTDMIIELLLECRRNPEFPINHKLWVEILAEANRDAEVRKAFLDCHNNLQILIEQWLTAAIRDEGVSPDIDVGAVARLLFAFGQGLVVWLEDDTTGACGDCCSIIEDTVRIILRHSAKNGG